MKNLTDWAGAVFICCNFVVLDCSNQEFLFLMMPAIQLTTFIKAPVKVCFDLSRSIDLHKISTAETHEHVIAGRSEGLIELNETVTWKAKHLGVWQTLTSKITEFNSANYFVDEMVSGAFKSFRHEHHFEESGKGTLMKDVFTFESPFGILGKFANWLFLTRYMTRFLEQRNNVIKDYAESDKAEQFIRRGVIG